MTNNKKLHLILACICAVVFLVCAVFGVLNLPSNYGAGVTKSAVVTSVTQSSNYAYTAFELTFTNKTSETFTADVVVEYNYSLQNGTLKSTSFRMNGVTVSPRQTTTKTYSYSFNAGGKVDESSFKITKISFRKPNETTPAVNPYWVFGIIGPIGFISVVIAITSFLKAFRKSSDTNEI